LGRSIEPRERNCVGGLSVAGTVDLDLDAEGNLYYLARGRSDFSGGSGEEFNTGAIVKISFTGSQAPSIALQPTDQTVAAGQSATFNLLASGAPPLAYQWQKNGENIPSAHANVYLTPPTTAADDSAQFRCIVSNSFGADTSAVAMLRVIGGSAPVAIILSPNAGATYNAGTTLVFSGTGNDVEDGDLPASALTWKIDFHHDEHAHPAMPPTTGITSGSYDIPDIGEASPNVWLRLYLHVRDSEGLTHSVFRDIQPNKTIFTLATEPPGLQVMLDGQPQATPLETLRVVGLRRRLGVISPQNANGVTYEFVSWSDGGAASHEILTPANDTTFTAVFRALTSTSAVIVNWGGDYVEGDEHVRGYETSITFNVELDSGFTGARWHCPFSEDAPLTPLASYDKGASWKFYGGVLLESFTNRFDFKWAEIWNRGANDQLYYGAPPGTHGWDLRYWKKEDFLNDGAQHAVTFTPESKLEILDYQGGDGVPANNSGRVRFVVREGGQFFISEDFAGPATTNDADFVLSNPGSARWAIYNPSAPHAIKFDWANASFTPQQFTNVTAVGYLHSNDNVPAPAQHEAVCISAVSKHAPFPAKSWWV